MQFSPQQDNALRAIHVWFHDPDAPQEFDLGGYAGTGKTTLAKHVAQDIDGDVVFCAFTGKASLVLRNKGCHNARTIHSLIYKPFGDTRAACRAVQTEIDQERAGLEPGETTNDRIQLLEAELVDLKAHAGKTNFILNYDSDLRRAKLCIVDESSMVSEDMWRDLRSFGVKILRLGDPAQLPPVFDGGAASRREPDFLLTEIHRQAAENPILRLATMARQQEWIPLGDYGDGVMVLSKDDARRGELAMRADQIIVGRNATRHSTNTRIRELRGITDPWPQRGERVVCLRNEHKRGLMNGGMFRLDRVESFPQQDLVNMVLTSEDGCVAGEVEATTWAHHFLGRESELKGDWSRLDHDEFDFGYALTCHKSQGSEWPHVWVLDESAAFRENRWKWLYTALTRASHRLTLVK